MVLGAVIANELALQCVGLGDCLQEKPCHRLHFHIVHEWIVDLSKFIFTILWVLYLIIINSATPTI